MRIANMSFRDELIFLGAVPKTKFGTEEPDLGRDGKPQVRVRLMVTGNNPGTLTVTVPAAGVPALEAGARVDLVDVVTGGFVPSAERGSSDPKAELWHRAARVVPKP